MAGAFEPRQHRPRLGESAVGGSDGAAGLRGGRKIIVQRITSLSAAESMTIRSTPTMRSIAARWEALPKHLRRAFLDGDWTCSLGNILMCLKWPAHCASGRYAAGAVAAALDSSTGISSSQRCDWHVPIATSIGIPKSVRDEGPSSAERSFGRSASSG